MKVIYDGEGEDVTNGEVTVGVGVNKNDFGVKDINDGEGEDVTNGEGVNVMEKLTLVMMMVIIMRR